MELREAIEKWFDINTSDFTDDTMLSEFIHDDFDLSTLIELLGSEFGKVVDDTVAESWKTMADVSGFIGED
jgi:acyl carrier protein